MKEVTRRSALAIGATVTTTAFLGWRLPAAAQAYGATEGNEIFPGVRVVTLGTRDAMIKAYKTVEMVDVVFQPGAEFPVGEPMEHDMVCMVTEGELQVKAGDMEFAAKVGDVWSCGKASTTEAAKNSGSVPAIMRTVYLKSA
jgi:redox-sensitive bicupin YhaK (pirin superfamily)